MKPHPLMSLTPIAASSDVDVTSRLAAMRACTTELGSTEAWSEFRLLEDDFEEIAAPLRRLLLETPLAWTDGEKSSAGWIHRCSNDFSMIGHRLCESFARQLGPDAERTRAIMAHTLFFMGETVKWEVAVTPEQRHDFAKPHGLMRAAMAGAHHRDRVQMRVDGRATPCTLESLYFRVMLLARFAGGTLNCKQIEILDAWIWQSMPVLAGVTAAPAGNALRADLDSSDGLRHGPREGDGPSIYLPQEPLEKAYRKMLAEFHAGRIVPSQGIAAGFRVEEHIAVLDLVRRGLRHSRREPAVRAERIVRNQPVEMLVGLSEITSRPGPGTAAAATPSVLTLVGAPERAPAARRDAALDDIYGAKRRMVRLADASESGLGLECAVSEGGTIAAGDLVAVSITPGDSPVIGKVVRSAPSKRPGRMVIGVRRLTREHHVVAALREQPGSAPEEVRLTYVPGTDTSGRHDAFLVSERAFAEPARFTARIGETSFAFRFNRVRQRGRGWVLAGFEVLGARNDAKAA